MKNQPLLPNCLFGENGTAMRFSFVVFDFDGTLVDSQAGILSSMQTAFAAYGLPQPTAESVRQVVGLKLELAVASLLPDVEDLDLAGRVADAYRRSFAALRTAGDLQEPLFPGARETIEKLDAAGALLGIATGKSRRGLMHALERHELRQFFVTLQTADDGASKPHPELLQQAMAEAGARPTDTVMVGDTTYDVEMARRADVTAVGVAWGYHAPASLLDCGAETIVARFQDLPPALAAKEEMSI